MAEANPKFVVPADFDPANYTDKRTTNVTITEALQSLTGAINTMKGTKLAKEVMINDTKSITVDQYSIVVSTPLDIDEIQSVFSAIQTYKDESGYVIQDGGFVELTANAEKIITIKHRTAIGGIRLLGEQDKLLSSVPIIIMKNGDFWEEQVSAVQIATDLEASQGIKKDVSINPKQLSSKANTNLGNVTEPIDPVFQAILIAFLREAPDLVADLNYKLFTESEDWIPPRSGAVLGFLLHGGGGGGGGGAGGSTNKGAVGGAGGGVAHGVVGSSMGGAGGGVATSGNSAVGFWGGGGGWSGGGGGGGGGGGSAGGTIVLLDVTKGSPVTVTVGSGGTAGSGGSQWGQAKAGGDGGASIVSESVNIISVQMAVSSNCGGLGGQGSTGSEGSSGQKGGNGSVYLVYLSPNKKT